MRKACLMLAAILVLILLTVNAFSWQIVGSPISVNIPPNPSAFSREFDLLVYGRVNITYTIQGGSVRLYFLTNQQMNEARVREPMELGRDFIMKSEGVVGKGNFIVPNLAPGRYAVSFQNEAGTPIILNGSIFAQEGQ